jgi:hypothetical protein
MPYVIHITLTSNPFFNLYVKMKMLFLCWTVFPIFMGFPLPGFQRNIEIQ